MPMKWDAHAEAKLFAAVFHVRNIKLSGDELKQIAQIMGPECTPKAVTHRIAKLRSTPPADLGPSAVGRRGDTDSAVGIEEEEEEAEKKEKESEDKATPQEKKADATRRDAVAIPNASKKRNAKGKMKTDSGDVLLDDREIAFGEDLGQGFRKKRVVEAWAGEGEEEEGGDGLF